MTKTELNDIKFLNKMSNVYVSQLEEFHEEEFCKKICDDAIDTCNRLIKILSKYSSKDRI